MTQTPRRDTHFAEAPADVAEYRPIGDYALIGDTRTAALVSSGGSIDWLCLPSFSDPSVFAAILDAEKGGRFSITPAEPYRCERRYGDGSACLQTSFVAGAGRAALDDMMVLPKEDRRCFEPQRELLRRLRVTEGLMRFRIVYEPRPDYARRAPKLKRLGKLGWRCSYGGHLLNLLTDAPLTHRPDGCGAAAEVTLEAGQSLDFSLSFSETDIAVFAPLGERAAIRAQRTEDWWRNWGAACAYDGPGRDSVVRSAVTLKLMTYGLSGAVIAAPTTSLPEVLGGMRNWDYRYCWLRDASLTMHAFLGLGYKDEGAAFFNWLLHSTRLTAPRLAVLYDVFGRTRTPERTLDHLEGYGGSAPVRIGNEAVEQTQLDIYGAVILAAFEFCKRNGGLDRYEGKLLADLGRSIEALWACKESGIWEIRGRERHYTYGKIMCWAGLDRLVRMAEAGVIDAPANRFAQVMDEIRETVLDRAVDPDSGALMGSFADGEPDAALYLAARYGFLDATDPIMAATAALIEERLADGALVHRYPPHWDPMPGEEAAFGICSFWRVDYLARAGRVEAACAAFETLCGYANDLGLFGEEIAAGSGAALGNFPQAFTHVGLINAALALQEAIGRGRATQKGFR